MIVGERFVWAHLPKTAGDATARMFAAVAGLALEHDDPRSQRKHRTIEAAVADGLDVAGRTTICNIRRLPDWVLSSARHQLRHYGVPPDRDALRLGVVTSQSPLRIDRVLPAVARRPLHRWRRRVERVAADEVLARHTAVPIDRWLRQEHLADDFLAVVGELHPLSAADEAAVRGVPLVNAGHGGELTRDAVFSEADLVGLYERNPGWAAIERRCYGATMVG